MRKLFLILLTLSASTLFIQGCYYDVEEELYGVPSCDTTAVTYSGIVAPMLTNNGCLSCHSSPATNGGGNVLDNYNSIKQLVDNGVFVSGAERMPPTAPILNDCNIQQLQSWVDAGALNN
jgi:hypothetical protein